MSQPTNDSEVVESTKETEEKAVDSDVKANGSDVAAPEGTSNSTGANIFTAINSDIKIKL